MKRTQLTWNHRRIGDAGLILMTLLLLNLPLGAQEVNYKKANYIDVGMGFHIGPHFGFIREIDQLALGVQMGRDGNGDLQRWVGQADVYYSMPILQIGDTKPFYARAGVVVSEFINNPELSQVLDAAVSIGYRLGYHNATIGTNYLGFDVGVLTSEAFDGRKEAVLPTASVKWCFGF